NGFRAAAVTVFYFVQSAERTNAVSASGTNLAPNARDRNRIGSGSDPDPTPAGVAAILLSPESVRHRTSGGSMRASSYGAAAGVLLAAIVATPRPVAADAISLTVNTGPSIPQKLNRPCVIGDPSCHNPST